MAAWVLRGLVYQRMGSVRLESDPRTFMENTLRGLSQMTRVSRKKLTEAQVAANQEKLREIGWDLYEQLFTPAVRRAYRAVRKLPHQQPERLQVPGDLRRADIERLKAHISDQRRSHSLCGHIFAAIGQ